jgi:hypothetical protein
VLVLDDEDEEDVEVVEVDVDELEVEDDEEDEEALGVRGGGEGAVAREGQVESTPVKVTREEEQVDSDSEGNVEFVELTVVMGGQRILEGVGGSRPGKTIMLSSEGKWSVEIEGAEGKADDRSDNGGCFSPEFAFVVGVPDDDRQSPKAPAIEYLLNALDSRSRASA